MGTENGAATDEIIKEQGEVLGLQMSVTNLIHKNFSILLQKNEIICSDGE